MEMYDHHVEIKISALRAPLGRVRHSAASLQAGYMISRGDLMDGGLRM